MLINVDGKILDIDSEIAQRFGGSREDILGQNIFALSRPESMAKRLAAHHQVLANREVVHFSDTGNTGHRYEMLLIPLAKAGTVQAVLVLAGEWLPVVNEVGKGKDRTKRGG